MKNYKTIIQLLPLLLSYYVMGFCDIVGLSSDYVQKSFDWSAGMTGFVPSMVFIWFLLFSIPVGNLMSRIGRKNTVMLSFAVTIIGMFLPLFCYNSTVCIIAFALLGIGNTIIQVALNPLVTNVITDSKLLTSSFTLGQVIKAISSLMGPEIVILAIATWGADKWYFCFPILGAITIITAIWLLLTPIQREEKQEETTSIKQTFALLKDNMMLILFVGILAVVGLDVGVNFISSKVMATRFDWDEKMVKYAPQTYFLCRTIGALLGSYLLTKVNAVKYFRANILTCIVVVLAFMFVKNAAVDMFCIGAIGFLASSVFTIIYSEALQRQPSKVNEVSGLMITAISGGAIVTPIIGFAIEAAGIVGGIAVLLVCTLYLTFCSFKATAK